MSKEKPPKVGDTVLFYYWSEDKLCASRAAVTAVHAKDKGPQALALDVDFTEEVMKREGYVREQTHSRQRLRIEDDVHTSGTWAVLSAEPVVS